MQSRTISAPPLDLRAAVDTVNADARTVDLTFTTGADVLRYDYELGRRYLERLSLDPKHIRLDRLNAGAPLLDSHSAYSIASQIGVVEDGTVVLTGKAGRATVRFSKRADVEPFYQDVLDKIIRNVSVGYRTYLAEDAGVDKKTGFPIRNVVDWEPYEISMVPMGADAGAKTRALNETNPCVIVTRTQDADRFRRIRLAQARY